MQNDREIIHFSPSLLMGLYIIILHQCEDDLIKKHQINLLLFIAHKPEPNRYTKAHERYTTNTELVKKHKLCHRFKSSFDVWCM